MKNSGKSIRADLDFIPRLTKKMQQKSAQYDKAIEQRMRRATAIVWGIAHQKRPMISTAQAKAEGRTKRVSDPNAQLGVPVRTGALQASIQQSVTKNASGGFLGKVWTKGVDYAGFIEFGTSRMHARPFMRPAVNLAKDSIKRLFGLKIDSNL
jgi:HK97 gp10 family phage protein